ncbi:MAG: DUF1501 domain-containing protein [Phycisphaera sp.]|nr:DUF1501 domain-containing protein [Phycisphaera sp.]
MSKHSPYPCNRLRPAPLSRRDLLRQCAAGFGTAALTGLMSSKAFGGAVSASLTDDEIRKHEPFAPRRPHFTAKATSVIFLYMDGGPSQVDTFDPKPRLQADDGKPFAMKMEPTQFNNNGNTLGSPWKFKNHGQSGIPVSSLFPNVAKHVDDMAIIRSMTSLFNEHTNANYFLHTGIGVQGRPSMGAWVTYGLGSACENLPGFVVINTGLTPPGGLDNFNSGFLPATYQGSVFRPQNPPVANIRRTEATEQQQLNKLALMRQLDGEVLERMGRIDPLESAIANYEMAFRMQAAVPDLMDFSDEPQHIKEMYGLETKTKGTAQFGTGCLIARRLVERGVRFIELTCPSIGHDRWDQHGGLKAGHADNAMATDQPIAALLADLKQRGMLDETLVIWSGEFGRTPFAQGKDGRDHNPYGFTSWMAGGGAKGGTIYGETDEYGYKAVRDKVEIYDLHATMLHLLGVDHTRQTFRYSGRDMRLTDVHGELIDGVIA